MIKVKCTKEICNHEWEYTGQVKNEEYKYITCPKCHNKQKLSKLIKNTKTIEGKLKVRE